MAATQQYTFRAQKSMGVVGGGPDYVPSEGFQSPEGFVRTYKYTVDGKLLGYALPSSVRVIDAETLQLVNELPIPNVIEIGFSPLGTYLSTWERPVKLEDGAQHKNLRVWNVATGDEEISFTQKAQENWDLQYTSSEDRAIRLVASEVQVFSPADWSSGITDKLRVEGTSAVSLSPGKNPSVAVFVGEKKGAPASVKIYGLINLTSPTCQKTFFKADKCTMKWNNLGTQVLVLTSTDVDKSNKSYYGETNLYLLTAAGTFDCRVTLDKEGPVHDFTWSPNSKEFGVVYGFMPAKTVLFDQRVNVTADFGSHPRNFISFNPQSRLLALAGFGNLAGKIDIFDRRSLQQVCTIDAPNTSWCEWSADGRSLLTATLSPRLRVDNGIKIWHCTGGLMHVQMVEELYQTSWRPSLPETAPSFGNTLPVAPAPAASVESFNASKPTPTKPAGAYRPPGARGSATPSLFKREDEGGLPRDGAYLSPSRNGSSTNLVTREREAGGRFGSPGPHSRGGPRRHVPGAPPPGSAPRNPPHPEGGEGEGKKKKKANNKKDKRAGKEEDKSGLVNGASASPNGTASPNASGTPKGSGKAPPSLNLAVVDVAVVSDTTPAATSPIPPTPGMEGLDPLAKKIRNLNKKLKAIEELKEKVTRGERMEVTQLKKIESEPEIRQELNALLADQA
ncbi:hypothetical protein FRC03_002827 [Tulasnella sp. 419]|nr:hypothetical protein FRC03_002827 [Tulasnella sp. 419]